MDNGTYAVIPMADIHGNAGSMGPGEREQRFTPFVEKVRLKGQMREDG